MFKEKRPAWTWSASVVEILITISHSPISETYPFWKRHYSFFNCKVPFISKHTIPRSSPGGHQIQWAGFFFCSLVAKLPSRLRYKTPGQLVLDHQRGQNPLEGDQKILGNRIEVNPPLLMPD